MGPGFLGYLKRSEILIYGSMKFAYNTVKDKNFSINKAYFESDEYCENVGCEVEKKKKCKKDSDNEDSDNSDNEEDSSDSGEESD